MDGDEKQPKKVMFVGSKSEEYAHRIHCHYDNRLSLEIRYYEIQKDVFLKTFRAERKAVLQKQEEIDERLQQLQRVHKTASRILKHYK
jgi:hypothetical protein